MTDVHDKKTRSYNMSQIKFRDTKPELKVRKYLHSKGFRYRLNVNYLPGKPDIVLKKYNTIILVNGCFWHGHEGCKYFKIPQTRTKFWQKKIGKTVLNDLKITQELEDLGWKVIVIWECELKKDKIKNTLEVLPQKILLDFIPDISDTDIYYDS